MKIGRIFCPETSLRNHQYRLRNNTEERASHILRGGSLKSRTGLIVDSILFFRVTTPFCLLNKYRSFGVKPRLLFQGRPIRRSPGTTYQTAQCYKPRDYSAYFVVVRKSGKQNVLFAVLVKQVLVTVSRTIFVVPTAHCLSYSTDWRNGSL